METLKPPGFATHKLSSWIKIFNYSSSIRNNAVKMHHILLRDEYEGR